MKNFFKTFAAIFAVTAFFATSSFAGVGGDPITCARQLRDCLKVANQMEATAKAAKRSCEAAATTPAAKAQCQTDYNAAMQLVANKRSDCKFIYNVCIGGGYEE